MKSLIRTFFLAIICQFPHIALACQPLPAEALEDTQRRVYSDFKAAKFVVLATIISVKDVKYATKSLPDYKLDAEKVKFRIDEVFKGTKKVGEFFEVLSYSTCARSVKGRKGIPYGPQRKKIDPRTFKTQWILYYTPSGDENVDLNFQITASTLSRPAREAAFDIAQLRRLVRNKTKPM
ncbi:hypothetical protein RF679_13290 [Undibacterium cyanobacteriorum]|uniref:DUF4136 domain-containing protein n=1 Tax=Undibacterium cyanobacteriorum TaxID=3073561 RepID=A0ABY9RG61_9BURK|nr:hypothetical protein [Undibacterium sp. 20NA77.5]WMW79620.1 hypothetical protein RF679_13290 [Undibacterium sp. 20NA77.5]